MTSFRVELSAHCSTLSWLAITSHLSDADIFHIITDYGPIVVLQLSFKVLREEISSYHQESASY